MSLIDCVRVVLGGSADEKLGYRVVAKDLRSMFMEFYLFG
jgi:hypothetical protein